MADRLAACQSAFEAEFQKFLAQFEENQNKTDEAKAEISSLE